MKVHFLVFLSLISLQAAFAEDLVVLNESMFKEMIEKEPPSVQQIKASFLRIKRERMAKLDKFGFRLDGEGKKYSSNEKLLNNFDGGVTRKATIYSIGISKPTKYGIDLGAKLFGSETTNAFVTNAATTGASFNLTIDLLQNFLGRKINNDLKKSEVELKRAELEKQASLKTFESNLRKLYWALVANNEQRILLSSLVKFAKRQYFEALKREKSEVADSGEVARYHSEWTNRKATLLSFEYQKGTIIRSLKELLPQLNGKKVEIGKYSIDATIQAVLSCSSKIRSYKDAPFKFTHYDEIVELLYEEEKYEQKIAQTYNDAEIKLLGEYSRVGRDFGLEGAREDFTDSSKSRTSIGIKISIPFGGEKKATEEVTEKLLRNHYQAQAKGNLSKIKSYHSETAEMIGLLKDVVKNQKETNIYLSKSINVSQKKYKQARISLQELISEQNSHLQSKLNEIDTNLTIINTLMDYFSIYNDFPCGLNRI